MTEALRERPLKSLLVLDSDGPSMKDGGEDESCEEKVGGLIISCVCVSERMNVKMGGSYSGARAGDGASRCCSTFSFFLRISRRGILARYWYFVRVQMGAGGYEGWVECSR